MKRLLGIILALASTRAGADALGDMKAAMERLSAKQPVRATFSTEATVKSAGRFANDNSARAVSTEVTHDAAGVSIAIPQALIDKASQEAKVSGDGENKAQNLIGSIRTIAVVEALDFRAPLLVMLHNATVAEEQRVAFRGRPARMLTLKLNPRTGKESGVIRIGTLKTDDHMKLWIGDDNLPVAAERIEKKTGGFMFVRGTFTSRSSYTFAHTPDRFILARVETSDNGSGMGQKVERNGVQTLTLH